MESKNYQNQKIGQSGVAKTEKLEGINKINTPVRPKVNDFRNTKPLQGHQTPLNVGNYFQNDSQYDSQLGDVHTKMQEEGQTIDNLRSREQSGWDIAGNALANNLAITATTVLGNTIGTVEGIISAIAQQDYSKMWDNNTSNLVADMQDSMRKNFPIYRGKDYEEKSLASKLGTGVFWGDMYQNLGYTQGSIIAGMMGGGALAAMKAPAFVRGAIPSLLGSVGESATESVQNRNDKVLQESTIATDTYKQLYSQASTPEERIRIYEEYNDTLGMIRDDANKAGNTVFTGNMAILTLSNYIQFGKLFSGGYGTNRKLTNALFKDAEGKFIGTGTGKATAAAIGSKTADALSEGMEEVSQGVLSHSTSIVDDYNRFNNSKFNSEKRELVTNIWSGLSESFAQKMKDPNTAVEFTSGFFTGMLGVPMISRNKQGKFRPTIENSIVTELTGHIQEAQRSQSLANSINERLANDKTMNAYYNGMVRNLTIQEDLNKLANSNDKFEYKNLESAQLISDIDMFYSAGHIDTLKDIVNNSINLEDDAVIDSLINDTQVDSNGNGPFMSNGNPMSREQVREKIKDNQKKINAAIDSYMKSVDIIDSNYPQLNSESRESAIFLHNTINNLNDRAKTVEKELISSFQSLQDTYKAKDPKNPTDITITSVDLINKVSDPKEYKQLLEAIKSNEYSLPATEKGELTAKLIDYRKILEISHKASKNLNDIISNPEVYNTKANKNVEQQQEVFNKETSDPLVNKLSTATSLSHFRNILKNEQDDTKKENALERLRKEGNSYAEELDKVDSYKRKVLKKVREDVRNNIEDRNIIDSMLDKHFNGVNSLEEASNVVSKVLNDSTNTYRDDLTPEQNEENYKLISQRIADYMNLTNEEEGLNKSFKRGQSKPNTNSNTPNPNASTQTTSGSSDTATTTIASISIDDTLSDSDISDNENVISEDTDMVVGDISNDDIKNENKNLNNNSDTPNTSKSIKQYWMPAIPELHIEGSKEGNFNPYNIIVKEREGKDFDTIYNYLKDNGAFDYVNSGKLKVGDTIHFIIDPNYEAQNHYDGYVGPTVFMAVKLDNGDMQIVGDLSTLQGKDANGNIYINSKVKQSIGLEKLLTDVINEYNNRTIEQLTPLEQEINLLKQHDDIINGISKTIQTKISVSIDKDGQPLFPILKSYVEQLNKGERVDMLIEDYAEVKYEIEELNKRHPKSPQIQEFHNSFVTIGDNATPASDSNVFVSTPTSQVSQMMIGKVPTTDGQRDFKSIVETTEQIKNEKSEKAKDERQWFFGIVKNGDIVTNNNIDVNISPEGLVEGRLYVLIPNSKGTYAPMVVKTKSYGSTDNANVPELIDIFKKFASFSNSENKLDKVTYINLIQDLAKIFNLGDVTINWYEGKNGDSRAGFAIGKNKRQNGKPILNDKGHPEQDTYYIPIQNKFKDSEDNTIVEPYNEDVIIEAFNNTFKTIDPIFKVSVNDINTGTYNDTIVNRNILSSDIHFLEVKGGWFTVNPLNEKGEQIPAVNPKSTPKDRRAKTNTNSTPTTINNQNTVGGTESVDNGVIVPFRGKEFTVVLNGHNTIVKDNKGIVYDIRSKEGAAIAFYVFAKDIIDKETESTLGYGDFIYRKKNDSIYDMFFKEFIDKDSLKYEEILNDLKLKYPNYFKQSTTANTTSTVTSNSKFIENRPTERFSKASIEGRKDPNDPNSGPPAHIVKYDSNNEIVEIGIIFRDKFKPVVKSAFNPLKEEFDNADIVTTSNEQSVVNTNIEENTEEVLETVISLNVNTATNTKPPTIETSRRGRRNVGKKRNISTLPETPYKQWDKETELKWLEKVLPKLSKEDRLKFVEGLIIAGNNGERAWGMTKDGIITLSDIAAEGTLYHEAFHIVFDNLTSLKQKEAILKEAKDRYGDKSQLELEELLAEDFREYVMSQSNRNLGQRILDFFKSLYVKVMNWIGVSMSIDNYFRSINDSNYANKDFNDTAQDKYRKINKNDLIEIGYERIRNEFNTLKNRNKDINKGYLKLKDAQEVFDLGIPTHLKEFVKIVRVLQDKTIFRVVLQKRDAIEKMVKDYINTENFIDSLNLNEKPKFIISEMDKASIELLDNDDVSYNNIKYRKVDYLDMMLESFRTSPDYTVQQQYIKKHFGKDTANIIDAIFEIIKNQDYNSPTFGFVPNNKNTLVEIANIVFGDEAFNNIYFADSTIDDIQIDLSEKYEDAMMDFYMLKHKHPDIKLQFKNIKDLKTEYLYKIQNSLKELNTNSTMMQSIYDFKDFIDAYVNRNSLKFDRITEFQKEMLESKGWTKELFDNLPEQEKDNLIKCIGIV